MKTKILEFPGRGLAYRDAISLDRLNPYKNLKSIADKHLYKNGILRFKKTGNALLPVIRYEGETEDKLCVAFQCKIDAQAFVDLDLRLMTESLASYIRKNQLFSPN